MQNRVLQVNSLKAIPCSEQDIPMDRAAHAADKDETAQPLRAILVLLGPHVMLIDDIFFRHFSSNTPSRAQSLAPTNRTKPF